MLKWKTPKSIMEIKSFLGLAGYYIRFIEGFSKLEISLTQLNLKGQAYVWDTLCKKSFIDLKKKMTPAPILILQNLSESFVVYYDASMMGLGDVLM